MKRLFITITSCLLFSFVLYGQNDTLSMTSEYASGDLKEILNFEEIDYLKIQFVGGEALKSKCYSIKAKEFKDGELIRDTIIVDSKVLPKRFKTVNDTLLNLKVIAKQTIENKLKIMFIFPSFSTHKELDLIQTEDSYSLRNLANESKIPIKYDEPFYLLAYILPYDMGNGYKSYCAVGSSGKEAESWGKKFGVKHYLLFEMKFD